MDLLGDQHYLLDLIVQLQIILILLVVAVVVEQAVDNQKRQVIM
jgi:hypothetical protein